MCGWWGWLCICMYVHTYKSLKDCPLLHYTLCLYSYFYLFPISLLCCVYHIYTFSVLLFTLERLMICIIHMLRRLCIAVDNCYAGWYGLLPSSDVQWLQLTTTACSWKDRILLFSPLYSESLDLLILAQPVIGLDGINEPFSSCCVCIVFLWSHSPSCPHTLHINLWHMRLWVDYHNNTISI